MKILRLFHAGLVLAFAAAPLAAQTGNQSDNTGTNTTGSEAAGGFNALSGTGASFTPAQFQSVTTFLTTINNELMPSPLGGAGTPSAVNDVLGVVQGNPSQNQIVTQKLNGMWTKTGGALPSSGPGLGASGDLFTARRHRAAPDDAAELVAALSGLFSAFQNPEADNSGVSPAERLIRAVDEFNEFVDAVPEDGLRNPPEEFLIIHRILVGMVQAAEAGK